MTDYKPSGIEGIGSIPCSWDATKRIKDIFTHSKGLSITKEDLVDEGIAVISYGQIHSKENSGTSTSPSLIRYVEERHIRGCSNSQVHFGDFIFADTSEDLDGCGNCAYIDSNDTIYAGYHTIIFSSDKTDNRYLAYLFKTDAWRTQIRKKCICC
jgi:Type I restriction modification DNA specificity domain.